MHEDEIKLKGGHNAESVVRIGDAVHRSMGSNSAFVHLLLQHLEVNDFSYSPRFFGLDSQGREILSFIHGEVPRGIIIDERPMNACAKILRRFHDIAATSYLAEGRETICHYDFAPWNIIFKENEPVGVIDFDEATPGDRIEDLAYFIWTFLDLGIPEISDGKQIHRVVELCKSYGSEYCQGLVETMQAEQSRILEFRRNIVLTELNPVKKKFSLDAIDRIELSMKWLSKNSTKIEIGLARLL